MTTIITMVEITMAEITMVFIILVIVLAVFPSALVRCLTDITEAVAIRFMAIVDRDAMHHRSTARIIDLMEIFIGDPVVEVVGFISVGKPFVGVLQVASPRLFSRSSQPGELEWGLTFPHDIGEPP